MRYVYDFYADWCVPCQMMGKRLDSIDANFSNSIKRINVEDSEELVNEFNIRNVPTLVFIEDGKEVKRTGVCEISIIEEFLKGE